MTPFYMADSIMLRVATDLVEAPGRGGLALQSPVFIGSSTTIPPARDYLPLFSQTRVARRCRLLADDHGMWVEPIRLEPGHEVHCPHCRRWHAVVAMHREGTDYTKQMLFFACRGQQYYAGQIATVSGHETRPGSPEN